MYGQYFNQSSKMDKISTRIKDRILEIAEYKQISKEKFILGLNQKYANYKGISKKSSPSADVIAEISAKYPEIDIVWLLTGEGRMLRNAMDPKNGDLVIKDYSLKTDVKQRIQQIPLYTLEASVELENLFNSSQQVEDYISIPNLPKCDGAVYVVGDNMYPLLKSGDIVMFKQVQDIENGIFWGEMYLLSFEIAGDSYTMIKWLQRSEHGPEYIKLVSENQHHQPKDILLSSIKVIAFIKACIRINSMA